MIEKLKQTALDLEQKITQSAANHNVLVGYLSAVKDIIKMLDEGANLLVPNSEAAKTLDVINDAVTSVTAG